ncbi:hypothetical protein BGX38DRAFT_620690 [Terfezia claveryi]|nr:hypothetical protein BGX38DRAFT_620690 [Terfezia claveryi]
MGEGNSKRVSSPIKKNTQAKKKPFLEAKKHTRTAIDPYVHMYIYKRPERFYVTCCYRLRIVSRKIAAQLGEQLRYLPYTTISEKYAGHRSQVTGLAWQIMRAIRWFDSSGLCIRGQNILLPLDVSSWGISLLGSCTPVVVPHIIIPLLWIIYPRHRLVEKRGVHSILYRVCS